MTRITKLDPKAVERIAAGEVVRRPASVVKELVENSLDAGASKVGVEVENGGIDVVRVADDGDGMDEDDAVMAFERHATSKIEGVDDIDSVDTLGFRGEALPSIARVARVEMTTKPREGDVGGTRVVVDDGVEVGDAGRAVGTTVEVTDLFDSVPARRKSLSSPSKEFSRVSDVVTRYALARPDVSFRLDHDGNNVLSTPGSGDRVDALFRVYGRKVANRAVEFETEGGDVGVSGVVVRPSVTRSESKHVYTSVNTRSLSDETVRRATVEGYGDLLPGDRYPIAAVDVSVPPDEVDVNVHPSKAEVEFHDEDAVADAVRDAVRDALSTEDLTRKSEFDFDLPVSEAETEDDSQFDGVEVIGQFRDLYLLCESEDDLLVVDQHAAHERVNYERLRDEFEGRIESVELGSPETVELTPEEAAVVEEKRDELESLGFEIESFGGGTFRVRGVPAPFGRVEDVEAVHDVLDEFLETGGATDLRDEILKDVACHPSLKAGDELSNDEATQLVRELGSCRQPFACPHGRPTVLSVNEKKLAEGFGRESVRLG